MANPPISTRPAAPVGATVAELVVPDEPEDAFVLVLVAVAAAATAELI